ncbi:hypothetical protein [Congregibacter sp.]|uniref:hypothetical protein n=1 Tax=Congregibacter sp. TaxID=2744308 RepID=UPI003F6BDB79
MAIQPLESAEAQELIRALSERLVEQEYRDGPYAMSLAETLDELARAQDAAGAVELARRSRARALHLIRVNEGLYSTAQRPLIWAMLESLRREGDFETLDERYDYFFRLYGSGQPPWDGLRWSATLEYLRWQREALRLRLDRDPMQRLLRLHALHEDTLETLVSQVGGVDFRLLADATFSQVKTLYLIEDLIQPQPVFRERSNGFPGSEDPRNFNLQQERLENLQRSLRGAGRTLLTDLLAVIPGDEHRLRAQALLALADWLQWHGSSREARDLYERIWSELHSGGMQAVAEQWFSAPVPLPDNGVFLPPGSQRSEGPIEVRLSVREDGRAFADVSMADKRWQRSAVRLQRRIAATRYRPVLKDGRVVSADDLSVSYKMFVR